MAKSVFKKYPFVSRIVFYDVAIARKEKEAPEDDGLDIILKSVYAYTSNEAG